MDALEAVSRVEEQKAKEVKPPLKLEAWDNGPHAWLLIFSNSIKNGNTIAHAAEFADVGLVEYEKRFGGAR